MLAQLVVRNGFEHLVEQALQGLEQLTVTAAVTPNGIWPVLDTAPEGSLATFIEQGVYPDLLHRIAYKDSFSKDDLADQYWLAVIDREGNIHGRNWQQQADKNADNSLLVKHKQLQEATQLTAELSSELATQNTSVAAQTASLRTVAYAKRSIKSCRSSASATSGIGQHSSRHAQRSITAISKSAAQVTN